MLLCLCLFLLKMFYQGTDIRSNRGNMYNIDLNQPLPLHSNQIRDEAVQIEIYIQYLETKINRLPMLQILDATSEERKTGTCKDFLNARTTTIEAAMILMI